jgi:hypothetical protein
VGARSARVWRALGSLPPWRAAAPVVFSGSHPPRARGDQSLPHPRRRSDLSPAPGSGASTASQTRHSQAREGERKWTRDLSGAVRSRFAKVWFARGFARTCSPREPSAPSDGAPTPKHSRERSSASARRGWMRRSVSASATRRTRSRSWSRKSESAFLCAHLGIEGHLQPWHLAQGARTGQARDLHRRGQGIAGGGLSSRVHFQRGRGQLHPTESSVKKDRTRPSRRTAMHAPAGDFEHPLQNRREHAGAVVDLHCHPQRRSRPSPGDP